jgi:hypothetical protein
MGLDQQHLPLVHPLDFAGDSRAWQVGRVLVAIHKDWILDASRRVLAALIRESEWLSGRHLIAKIWFRLSSIPIASNLIENEDSLVSAYKDIVGVEMAHGRLANDLIADHGYNFALAVVVAAPEPVGHPSANLHTGKHVVELRKVNEFRESVIAEHPVTELVKALPAGKPSRGRNHHGVARFKRQRGLDKLIVNGGRGGTASTTAIAKLIRRVSDDHVKLHIASK